MNPSKPFALASVVCVVATIAAHSANAQPVQLYEYQTDRVYPVRAGLGISTQIELSPSEKVLDYSTGFSSGWELTRRDNVFYLKPTSKVFAVQGAMDSALKRVASVPTVEALNTSIAQSTQCLDRTIEQQQQAALTETQFAQQSMREQSPSRVH